MTIRQTEETTGRSYTGFLKSLFTGSGTTSTTAANTGGSTGIAPSLSATVPAEKLTELDVKGIKGRNSLYKIRKSN